MLLEHIVASNLKVLLGLMLALFLGLILALIRFYLPKFIQKNMVFNFIIDLIKFPPPIAWIPFVILLSGISFSSSLIVVVIGGMPPFFTVIYDILKNTEQYFINLCATLELSKFKSIFYVFLPSQYSKIYTGIRISLGMCWMSIIASEMISSQSGLGYLIQLDRINLDYVGVLTDILIIAVCGYVMNQIVHFVEKKHLSWKTS